MSIERCEIVGLGVIINEKGRVGCIDQEIVKQHYETKHSTPMYTKRHIAKQNSQRRNASKQNQTSA